MNAYLNPSTGAKAVASGSSISMANGVTSAELETGDPYIAAGIIDAMVAAGEPGEPIMKAFTERRRYEDVFTDLLELVHGHFITTDLFVFTLSRELKTVWPARVPEWFRGMELPVGNEMRYVARRLFGMYLQLQIAAAALPPARKKPPRSGRPTKFVDL